jgi:hypothetical protein
MDYESRQVKWYWLILFLGYSAMACYILFSGNPYLYSHHELRSALLTDGAAELQTIPSEPAAGGKPGAATYFQRYNFAHTGVDPAPGTRGKGYEEFEKNEVITGIDGWKPQHFAYDASGFYIAGTGGWLVAVGLDGKARWRYHFLKDPGERGLLPPLVDESYVYVVHPSGEVVAFDKMSGEIHWLLPLSAELVANPFLWGNLLLLPTKGPAGIQLVQITRANGKRLEANPRLDIKPGFQISHAASSDVLIATVESKVVAIDPENWAAVWSQTMTEPIKGPAVVVENEIFVATLGGKIVKLDNARKGKVDWEIQLEKPAAAPPTYLPIVNRLALIDTGGALSTIELKTGKVFWRYGIEAKGPVNEVWASRLSAKYIEENHMDWLHKGWTIWTFCGDKRVCIYTPLKGQLINRLNLTGQPMTPPLLIEHRLVFFTETKPGHYLLSHQVEEAEVKRIRKEAAGEKAAQ